MLFVGSEEVEIRRLKFSVVAFSACRVMATMETMETKLRMRDLANESLAGLMARPARAALTVLGTVLGRAAADRLNIVRVDQQPAIYIGNRLFTVLGIVGDVARSPELLDPFVPVHNSTR